MQVSLSKRISLILAITVVALIGLHYLPLSNATPVVAPRSAPVASEVADWVNVERDKAGLPRLVEDSKLDASAAAKCADMNTYHYHAHVSPSGVTPRSLFAPEYQDKHIGENLSWGYTSSQDAVNGWMGSPGHRGAILNATFDKVGYAVCSTEDGENLVVQHFVDL